MKSAAVFIRYKNNLFHIFDLSLAAIQVAKILLHMSIISSYFKVSTHEIIYYYYYYYYYLKVFKHGNPSGLIRRLIFKGPFVYACMH